MIYFPGDSIPKIICSTARTILFEKATTGGDRFRQWFYPRLPRNYDVRADLDAQIESRMCQGKSAQQIADEIYRENS